MLPVMCLLYLSFRLETSGFPVTTSSLNYGCSFSGCVIRILFHAQNSTRVATEKNILAHYYACRIPPQCSMALIILNSLVICEFCSINKSRIHTIGHYSFSMKYFVYQGAEIPLDFNPLPYWATEQKCKSVYGVNKELMEK